MTGKIASPCIKTCTLDAAGAMCIGCLRTVEEIARWGSFAPAERDRVMAALPARRRLVEGASATVPAQCTNCGATFGCGAADTKGACWCARLPVVAPRPGAVACLCPDCLLDEASRKPAF